MKKSLILLPLAAIMLSGCLPLPGGNSGATSGDTPASTSKTNPPAPVPSTTPTTPVEPSEFGTATSPLNASAFYTLVDKICTMPSTEGASDTYVNKEAYIKVECVGNEPLSSYGDMKFLNLSDGTHPITVMYCTFDASITLDLSTKNCLQGKTITVKGYPALYNKKGVKTYELLKKDNDNKPFVLKVE